MSQSNFHLSGIATTLIAHCAIAGVLFWTAQTDACGGGQAHAKPRSFDDAEVIEAALAFKAPEKKKRQPQKQRNPKVKPPDTVGASRDAERAPVERKDDPKKPPPEEMIDPSATFNKVRDLGEDVEPTDRGEDEQPEEGSPDGSEWGTEADAKGDPYLGELRGRIEKAWRRPTLDSGGGVVVGCVRLDASGKIVHREVVQRSKNSTLNRSVEEALRNASDMEEPVPDRGKLIELLTVNGVCFRFTPEEQ